MLDVPFRTPMGQRQNSSFHDPDVDLPPGRYTGTRVNERLTVMTFCGNGLLFRSTRNESELVALDVPLTRPLQE